MEVRRGLATDALCLAVKIDDGPTHLWAPNWVQELVPEIDFIPGEKVARTLSAADIIEAHNVEFERAIFKHVMARYGFDPLPIDKCRCTAARAARLALPRDLATVCKVVGCESRRTTPGIA